MSDADPRPARGVDADSAPDADARPGQEAPLDLVATADVVAVVGATGTGKSELALALAERHCAHGRRAEIVNADAMQLYRGMDVGTAKVPESERRGIPHHQLDVLEVTDEASVAAYQRDARAVIAEVTADGGVAVLVGGSGLYVSAVLFDLDFPGTDPVLREQLEREHRELGPAVLLDRLRTLDPAAAAVIDARNPRRLIRAVEIASRSDRVTPSLPSAPRPWRPAHVLHLRRDREQLVAGLHTRAERMFATGLLDEVAALRDRGLEQGRTARAAIGYAQALQVLRGEATVEQAVESTSVATRRYARRQVSWFKRYADSGTTRVGAVDVTGAGAAELSGLARRIVP
ncbi:tRNA (adenosine(37)-N6)-dimethylallyltransferase MiaA [Curtobacterium sp. MCBD17_032]|nr:tRNA (adenosine(37)-N6)-dimethylallyltransferase MiaA [Curtobacterium sp. MCBD17_032]PZE81348.1 tRNA (adenosine(37)-N6)-dimethylallyltransferase MiaA [Curtobacterium sp. MCBD17_032]